MKKKLSHKKDIKEIKRKKFGFRGKKVRQVKRPANEIESAYIPETVRQPLWVRVLNWIKSLFVL